MGKTYQERKAVQTFHCLTKNGVTIGVFAGLKKLCEAVKLTEPDFPSYWTLIRKKEQPLEVVVGDVQYFITEHRLNEMVDFDSDLTPS